jgi:hypothetical protein
MQAFHPFYLAIHDHYYPWDTNYFTHFEKRQSWTSKKNSFWRRQILSRGQLFVELTDLSKGWGVARSWPCFINTFFVATGMTTKLKIPSTCTELFLSLCQTQTSSRKGPLIPLKFWNFCLATIPHPQFPLALAQLCGVPETGTHTGACIPINTTASDLWTFDWLLQKRM